jgi:SpoVK/Ycf46/Vps4 family AAA+-type ATPase
LEFIPVPEKVQVGGHEDFKAYIQERGLFLDKTIRDKFKLKAPKGTLAVGVPGGGKSIMVKYIGFTWGIPVIRLDIGAIYQRYLGQSESRLREALKFIEYNTPCVLWVDEIEKSLGSNEGESGTSNRVLGKLLTWMAERTSLVYMFCTANNINKIPPEFLRSGRFDTIQWFDLPTIKDCEEIIKIHCEENNYDYENLDELARLAEQRNLTGAEIEEAIIAANFGRASGKATPIKGWLYNKLNEIKSSAIANQDNLMKMRKIALRDYEFTSKAAREKVEKLVNNRMAQDAEFNLNN